MGKVLKLLLLIATLTGAGWGGVNYFKQRNGDTVLKVSPDKLYKLKRGPMDIRVIQGGSFYSKKTHKLGLEASLNTKIDWVIKENSQVKTGDLLLRFDDEDLKSRIDSIKQDVEEAEKSLESVVKELDILKTDNKSSMKAAKDRVKSAEEALHKYRKLEGPQQKDGKVDAVQTAIENMESAKRDYEKTRAAQLNTVYSNEDEEERAEQQLLTQKQRVSSSEKAYEGAVLNRKIFKRYTYPERIEALTNSQEQAKLDLTKTEVRLESNVKHKESSIERYRERVERNEANLKRYQNYLTMMEIHAPVEGVVIYGDPEQGWNKVEPQVGNNAVKSQVLLTIPDVANLNVKFQLPEQLRSRVDLDNEAVLMPESLPGVSLKAKVSRIAALPVNQISWDSSSPKVYNVEIALVDTHPELVSGMSVQLEVITQRLEDVLFVPIEAVFDEESDYFVYLDTSKGPEKRMVEIGIADEDFVQLTEGVKDGESVFLFNPLKKKDK